MESKRSYIDRTAGDIKLPREVYYRCVWTVRDASRMKGLVSAGDTYSEDRIEEYRTVSDGVIRKAAEDLGCISRALTHVPEVYRYGIIDNIAEKRAFDDLAHPNTWKRWKLVFLYELAKELQMI